MPKQISRARLPRPSQLSTMTDRQFFRCLTENGPMTRAAIATATGISKPTISESAQRLYKQGLIFETDQRTSGHQGRGGVIYAINGGRGYALGIALETGRIEARALDLGARTIWEASEPLPETCPGSTLVERIEQLIQSSQHCTGLELLSIGFSIADPIDPRTGDVISLPQSPFPAAHDIHIMRDFGKSRNCPITIDNDVNWATLAESKFGCMKGEENFLLVYLGTGIGAGIFMSGQLQRGAGGLAGEIGYLETASGRSLLNLLSNQNPVGPGEGVSEPLDQQTLNAISKAIVTAATLLNPSAIVLSGPLIESDNLYRYLEKTISAGVLLPLPVKQSDLSHNGPLVGAVAGAHEQALAVLDMMDPATDIRQIGFTSTRNIKDPGSMLES